MQVKKDLAKRIITDFHSAEQATEAETNWAKQFQKDEVPENLETVTIVSGDFGAAVEGDGKRALKLDKVLVKAGLADSASDAQRKIKAGSVKIDGEPHKELYLHVQVPAEMVVRVGRAMKKVLIG